MATESIDGVLRYRVDRIEERINGLEDKIDKLIMAAVIASFTCAGAIILLALNLLVLKRG